MTKRYRKMCSCDRSTATIGRITSEYNLETTELTVTRHEGPVCDCCGIPWTEVNEVDGSPEWRKRAAQPQG
jgi:hypothetical protein